jgi:CRISPR-associated Cas5-like protein
MEDALSLTTGVLQVTYPFPPKETVRGGAPH